METDRRGQKMKVFVTGVAGQLGHDVMNELNKRGYEGIGSDLAPEYAGAQDGSAVGGIHVYDHDSCNRNIIRCILRLCRRKSRYVFDEFYRYFPCSSEYAVNGYFKYLLSVFSIY